MKRLASRIESGWISPEEMYAHLTFFETRGREVVLARKESPSQPSHLLREFIYKKKLTPLPEQTAHAHALIVSPRPSWLECLRIYRETLALLEGLSYNQNPHSPSRANFFVLHANGSPGFGRKSVKSRLTQGNSSRWVTLSAGITFLHIKGVQVFIQVNYLASTGLALDGSVKVVLYKDIYIEFIQLLIKLNWVRLK